MTEAQKLWKIRVKAFLVQAGTGLAIVTLGFIGSEDFRNLIIQNFGTGFITSSITLFITGLVSHIMNKMALKKLGSIDDKVILI